MPPRAQPLAISWPPSGGERCGKRSFLESQARDPSLPGHTGANHYGHNASLPHSSFRGVYPLSGSDSHWSIFSR